MFTQCQTRTNSLRAQALPAVFMTYGFLQRKCACGGSAGLTGECSECQSKRLIGEPLQGKLRLGGPGDEYEREADRVAEQVAANTYTETDSAYRRIQRFSAPSTERIDVAPASVDRALVSPGRPLEPALRNDMEQRFGHDFSRVRVHSGAAAEQSAREVHAKAYTVGHDIVFAAGQFAPSMQAGRCLLAHELTHVVQQTGSGEMLGGQTNGRHGMTSTSSPLGIQRQPDEDPSKKESSQKPPAKKTLKSEGVDLSDPVASGTARLIDEVLSRNQKLAPYIGDRLKAGFKIAEKGKFVHASTDGNFDDAYRDAYELSSSTTVPKHTEGFFDPKKSAVHLRPGAKFGTALHEAVHRLASPVLYSLYLNKANKVSKNLMEVLKEGVTAFFTDLILKDEKLPNFNDAYRSKKKSAEALIAALGADGFDLIATFNFKGTGVIEIGEKLGFTRAQFSASKGQGIEEVLKRMANVL